MPPPPVPVELLLAAYMAEVRHNGEWAVTNVGTADEDEWSRSEILYEILDSGRRAGIIVDAHNDEHGWPHDWVMGQAYLATQLAIRICHSEGVTREEALPFL